MQSMGSAGRSRGNANIEVHKLSGGRQQSAPPLPDARLHARGRDKRHVVHGEVHAVWVSCHDDVPMTGCAISHIPRITPATASCSHLVHEGSLRFTIYRLISTNSSTKRLACILILGCRPPLTRTKSSPADKKGCMVRVVLQHKGSFGLESCAADGYESPWNPAGYTDRCPSMHSKWFC